MKRSSKGFTLIELLAVIVILAIVAIIATPMVLNVIDQSKEKAVKASMAGYGDAVKLARYQFMFDHDGTEPTAWAEITTNLKAAGESPTCTTSTVAAKGSITLSGCKFASNTKYTCSYTDGVVACTP